MNQLISLAATQAADTAAQAADKAQAIPSNTLVVCLGVGTVFVGLICLVVICSLMSAIINAFVKDEAPVRSAVPQQQTSGSAIANKSEIIAAVSAVIAEELGTDVSNLRIHSFKKI